MDQNEKSKIRWEWLVFVLFHSVLLWLLIFFDFFVHQSEYKLTFDESFFWYFMIVSGGMGSVAGILYSWTIKKDFKLYYIFYPISGLPTGMLAGCIFWIILNMLHIRVLNTIGVSDTVSDTIAALMLILSWIAGFLLFKPGNKPVYTVVYLIVTPFITVLIGPMVGAGVVRPPEAFPLEQDELTADWYTMEIHHVYWDDDHLEIELTVTPKENISMEWDLNGTDPSVMYFRRKLGSTFLGNASFTGGHDYFDCAPSGTFFRMASSLDYASYISFGGIKDEGQELILTSKTCLRNNCNCRNPQIEVLKLR